MTAVNIYKTFVDVSYGWKRQWNKRTTIKTVTKNIQNKNKHNTLTETWTNVRELTFVLLKFVLIYLPFQIKTLTSMYVILLGYKLVLNTERQVAE